jgi:hypothetical protein
MPTVTIAGQINFNGVGSAYSRSIAADSEIAHDVTLAAGKAGVLTRSDANTGVATLAGGHGFITSDVLDCYWDTGQRLGMTATVATNDITLDGGVGDDLPVEAAHAVIVSARTEINTDFDGDEIAVLGVYSDLRASVKFEDGAAGHLLSVNNAGNDWYLWDALNLTASPLAGDTVGVIYASAGTAAATVLKIGVAYNTI